VGEEGVGKKAGRACRCCYIRFRLNSVLISLDSIHQQCISSIYQGPRHSPAYSAVFQAFLEFIDDGGLVSAGLCAPGSSLQLFDRPGDDLTLDLLLDYRPTYQLRARGFEMSGWEFSGIRFMVCLQQPSVTIRRIGRETTRKRPQ
jgi:hypothetical protein